MPVFRIPGPLRRLSQGEPTVDVEGGDVRSAIESLESRYPGFKERLLDEQGQPRQFVNIYLNDEDIRLGQGLDAEVKDSDEISIIPAVAGGRDLAGRRVRLVFARELVTEPVIYQLGHEFRIVPNIRRADVTRDHGWVVLELSGEPDEIDRGVAWLETRGVLVEAAEGDLVEG